MSPWWYVEVENILNAIDTDLDTIYKYIQIIWQLFDQACISYLGYACFPDSLSPSIIWSIGHLIVTKSYSHLLRCIDTKPETHVVDYTICNHGVRIEFDHIQTQSFERHLGVKCNLVWSWPRLTRPEKRTLDCNWNFRHYPMTTPWKTVIYIKLCWKNIHRIEFKIIFPN